MEIKITCEALFSRLKMLGRREVWESEAIIDNELDKINQSKFNAETLKNITDEFNALFKKRAKEINVITMRSFAEFFEIPWDVKLWECLWYSRVCTYKECLKNGRKEYVWDIYNLKKKYSKNKIWFNFFHFIFGDFPPLF